MGRRFVISCLSGSDRTPGPSFQARAHCGCCSLSRGKEWSVEGSSSSHGRNSGQSCGGGGELYDHSRLCSLTHLCFPPLSWNCARWESSSFKVYAVFSPSFSRTLLQICSACSSAPKNHIGIVVTACRPFALCRLALLANAVV